MSKAPLDWTKVPQAFNHGVWHFGLVFGDPVTGHELRATSEGSVEKRSKNLDSGEDRVETMHGKSKEEILGFYEASIMKAWEKIGAVKTSRLNRTQVKQSETLIVRRGVQGWNWQFLADQPPQEIAELYALVKDFFAPWIYGDGALRGKDKQEPARLAPMLLSAEAESAPRSPQDLLTAANAMSAALQQLNQVIDAEQ